LITQVLEADGVLSVLIAGVVAEERAQRAQQKRVEVDVAKKLLASLARLAVGHQEISEVVQHDAVDR
jgi:hypothetical protein